MQDKVTDLSDLLGEVAVQVESASDSGKLGETVDNLVLGVVLDGETTTNLLELGHRDVVEVGVGDDGQITLVGANVGEVGAHQALELVRVETERAVDGDERVQGDLGDVAEGHVVGPDEVGEDGRDIAAVGLNGQRFCDVTKLHLDIVEPVVVGDIDRVDDGKVDTVERLQLGVLDVEHIGLLDTGAEREALKTGKSIPDDRVDHAELREREGRKDLQAIELELATNGLEAVGRNAGDQGVVESDKIARDLSNTRERDSVREACSNGNGAREGSAARESRSVSGSADGGGTGSRARRLGVGTASNGERRHDVLDRHCGGRINCEAASAYKEDKRGGRTEGRGCATARGRWAMSQTT